MCYTDFEAVCKINRQGIDNMQGMGPSLPEGPWVGSTTGRSSLLGVRLSAAIAAQGAADPAVRSGWPKTVWNPRSNGSETPKKKMILLAADGFGAGLGQQRMHVDRRGGVTQECINVLAHVFRRGMTLGKDESAGAVPLGRSIIREDRKGHDGRRLSDPIYCRHLILLAVLEAGKWTPIIGQPVRGSNVDSPGWGHAAKR